MNLIVKPQERGKTSLKQDMRESGRSGKEAPYLVRLIKKKKDFSRKSLTIESEGPYNNIVNAIYFALKSILDLKLDTSEGGKIDV